MDLGEASIGLDGMVMVFNGSQPYWPNDLVYGTGYHDPTEVGGGDQRREKRSFAHQVPLRCNCPLVLLGELFIRTFYTLLLC